MSSGSDPRSLFADPTQLSSTIYRSLHELAAHQLRDQRQQQSLQPTALVHEAWLRIAKLPDVRSEHRAQFFALAGKAMRSVVVDYARRRLAQKRQHGDSTGIDAAEVAVPEGLPSTDVIAIDEAMTRLEAVDPELVRVVDLMFFCGKTAAEAATLLSTSSRTIERRWRFARAWLRNELGGGVDGE